VPSLKAFVVTELLERHCPSFVDSNFTATMEARLDDIASGLAQVTLS
jgi:DNA topoisomerase IA